VVGWEAESQGSLVVRIFFCLGRGRPWSGGLWCAVGVGIYCFWLRRVWSMSPFSGNMLILYNFVVLLCLIPSHWGAIMESLYQATQSVVPSLSLSLPNCQPHWRGKRWEILAIGATCTHLEIPFQVGSWVTFSIHSNEFATCVQSYVPRDARAHPLQGRQ